MGKRFKFVRWQACPEKATVAVVMGDFNCKSICASSKPLQGGEADERTKCPTVLLLKLTGFQTAYEHSLHVLDT
jgi:hypothetical protein